MWEINKPSVSWEEGWKSKVQSYKKHIKKAVIWALDKTFSLSWAMLSKILEKLSVIDQEHDFYSQWFQWRVFKVDIETENGIKHLLIIKNRVAKNTKNGNRFIDEYGFQTQANEILQNHNDIQQHINVPKVRGIINDHESNQFLIMDYIESDTFFGHNVRGAIPMIYNELHKLLPDSIDKYIENYENIIDWTEYSLKKYVIKLLRLYTQYGHDSELYNKYMPLARIDDFQDNADSKRLEEKINRICAKIHKDMNHKTITEWWKTDKMEAAHKLIKLFHENHIYHNDITSRNILIGNDGKIYLIDFGNATHQQRKQSDFQKSMSSPSAEIKNVKKYKDTTIEGDFKLIQMIQDLS